MTASPVIHPYLETLQNSVDQKCQRMSGQNLNLQLIRPAHQFLPYQPARRGKPSLELKQYHTRMLSDHVLSKQRIREALTLSQIQIEWCLTLLLTILQPSSQSRRSTLNAISEPISLGRNREGRNGRRTTPTRSSSGWKDKWLSVRLPQRLAPQINSCLKVPQSLSILPTSSRWK